MAAITRDSIRVGRQWVRCQRALSSWRHGASPGHCPTVRHPPETDRWLIRWPIRFRSIHPISCSEK